MKKLLKLLLATSVLSLSSIAISPGIALAEACTTPAPVGTDGVTVEAAGQEINVPGVKVQICGTPHGNVNDVDQWLVPRFQPGVCDPSIFDPACFTIYVDSNGIPHWTNWTVYTWVSGNPIEPISIDIPPIPQPLSICVLTIGYRTAPEDDCEEGVSVHLGQ